MVIRSEETSKKDSEKKFQLWKFLEMVRNWVIYAEVVARVSGSLEAGGLPGYPESLFVEINMMKSWQRCLALYFTQILKTYFTWNVYMFYSSEREK